MSFPLYCISVLDYAALWCLPAIAAVVVMVAIHRRQVEARLTGGGSDRHRLGNKKNRGDNKAFAPLCVVVSVVLLPALILLFAEFCHAQSLELNGWQPDIVMKGLDGGYATYPSSSGGYSRVTVRSASGGTMISPFRDPNMVFPLLSTTYIPEYGNSWCYSGTAPFIVAMYSGNKGLYNDWYYSGTNFNPGQINRVRIDRFITPSSPIFSLYKDVVPQFVCSVTGSEFNVVDGVLCGKVVVEASVGGTGYWWLNSGNVEPAGEGRTITWSNARTRAVMYFGGGYMGSKMASDGVDDNSDKDGPGPSSSITTPPNKWFKNFQDGMTGDDGILGKLANSDSLTNTIKDSKAVAAVKKMVSSMSGNTVTDAQAATSFKVILDAFGWQSGLNNVAPLSGYESFAPGPMLTNSNKQEQFESIMSGGSGSRVATYSGFSGLVGTFINAWVSMRDKYFADILGVFKVFSVGLLVIVTYLKCLKSMLWAFKIGGGPIFGAIEDKIGAVTEDAAGPLDAQIRMKTSTAHYSHDDDIEAGS